ISFILSGTTYVNILKVADYFL
ncbi:hypothetical protein TNIN_431901, partial [Trichonephila inaurata madagascariensis]